MDKITVRTQADFDNIPYDYKGKVEIISNERIIVNKKLWLPVEARENSSVVARGNSSVVARENSSVEAWENSSVEAWENSSVEAWGNSSVVARGNSSVEAWENSSVVARGNSSVVAWENSSVVARENTQILDLGTSGKLSISGNSRIVYMPKDINAFMDFYGIDHDDKTAVFYKAVHKADGRYVSNYDKDFIYVVGREQTEECDLDTAEYCGTGIHIAHRDWALDFGREWADLAILEVETAISDIVMPDSTNGKVRTSKIKVLREVPLEECGALGKILKKRQDRANGEKDNNGNLGYTRR